MTDISITALKVKSLPGAMIRSFQAGEAIDVGEIVYIKSDDGKVYLADASAAGTAAAVGMVVAVGSEGASAAAAGDWVSVVLFGPVAIHASLTPGALAWVSDTAGAIADAAGTVKLTFGRALSDDILWIAPAPETVDEAEA